MCELCGVLKKDGTDVVMITTHFCSFCLENEQDWMDCNCYTSTMRFLMVCCVQVQVQSRSNVRIPFESIFFELIMNVDYDLRL